MARLMEEIQVNTLNQKHIETTEWQLWWCLKSCAASSPCTQKMRLSTLNSYSSIWRVWQIVQIQANMKTFRAIAAARADELTREASPGHPLRGIGCGYFGKDFLQEVERRGHSPSEAVYAIEPLIRAKGAKVVSYFFQMPRFHCFLKTICQQVMQKLLFSRALEKSGLPEGWAARQLLCGCCDWRWRWQGRVHAFLQLGLRSRRHCRNTKSLW